MNPNRPVDDPLRPPTGESFFAERRARMVEADIAARGIRDPRVLEAMRRVPREAFVVAALADSAYDDRPLPIECGQTISQPYVVADMLEAARIGADDRVLEVGAGSGYASAVLSLIARRVVAVERHAELARIAGERLACLGHDNVAVHCGDGTRGWPDDAPYDAIVVAAGGPRIPASLREQLAVGGRLVMPVGDSVGVQRLVRVTRRTADDFDRDDLAAVRFVPLIGAEGWSAGD